MKIAVIVPDRGDRPEFLERCEQMIAAQTMQPESVLIANWLPKSSQCDITERYRIGYHSFDNQEYDCILFMENDDWYRNDYIETMVNHWQASGRPDIFGTGYTIYYHIGNLHWMNITHPRRASMMNTLIKPDLDINWPVDSEPYTDAHLWRQLKGITWKPETPISIGIKHGVGMSGGHYHSTKLERYPNFDPDMRYLSSIIDQESLTFYAKIHGKIHSLFENNR